MQNSSIFKPQNVDIVKTDITIKSKKSLLEYISTEIGKHTNIPAASILARLALNEKEQTSAIGNGVAIPHCRIMQLNKPVSILIKLNNTIDLASADNKPVDIIYAVISPSRDGALHLQRLSTVSRIFKNKDFVDLLREIPDANTLRNLLHAPKEWMLAA